MSMSIRTMRRIDRWLGVPCCAMLTLVRRLRDLLSRRGHGPVRRILFVKLAEQGSTVLAYPAIRRAVDRVGPDNVYFLAFAENRFILDAMAVIPESNVITVSTSGTIAALGGALAAIRRLRRLKLDAAVDLEFFARSSAVFCYLSGAHLRSGFHAFFGEASYRGDLMTHRVSFNPHLHTAESFRLLIEVLDQDPRLLPAVPQPLPKVDETPPPFRPPDDEFDRFRRKLLGLLRATDVPRLVLLNANCSDMLPLRAWPADRYVELATRILGELPDVWIAFTGGLEEQRAADELAAKVNADRCISLAGRTTLRELLMLYISAQVLVTNDSGPAHFATLTPIDVVTMFGPETPALFAARSPRNHVLWSGLPCSPCVSAYNDRQTACRNNLCMKTIDVESVCNAVLHALRQRAENG